MNENLDIENNDENFTIISKEGERLDVLKKVAKCSNLLNHAIGDGDTEVELKHVKYRTIELVMQWLKHHVNVPMKEIERPLKSVKMEEIVDDFDANFVNNMNQDEIFRVLLCANYMDIPPLLNLMCAKVASMLKGKSGAQIKEIFGIKDDATPEEIEAIKNEYKDLLDY